MARIKTRPDAAPSAAHAAPDPAPAPDAATAGDSPAAAVCAALAANPAATVAAIAAAAATGKPATRDTLLAMEKDGTATRVKGGKPGIPDTWTLTGPAPDSTGPAAPDREQPGQPDGSPGDASENETADGTGPGRAAGTDDPAPQDSENAGAGTSAAPGPEADQPGVRDAAPAGDGHEDAAPDEPDSGEAAPDSGAPQDPDAAPAVPGGEASSAPDPALVTDLTERITQIKAAADATAAVLAADEQDLPAALAGLDEIYEQATQARRSLKAAIGGKKTPAARPGSLRDKVLAHLDTHPGAEFTPHEIHKVIDHSSGAIANALDTLVSLGEAELATDKPRRFRRAANPDAPAPAAAGTGDAASAEEDSTELAGAA
jgi:hypothetical protein